MKIKIKFFLIQVKGAPLNSFYRLQVNISALAGFRGPWSKIWKHFVHVLVSWPFHPFCFQSRLRHRGTIIHPITCPSIGYLQKEWNDGGRGKSCWTFAGSLQPQLPSPAPFSISPNWHISPKRIPFLFREQHSVSKLMILKLDPWRKD